MGPSRTRSLWRPLTWAVVVVLLGLLTSACGGDNVDPALKTSSTQPFATKKVDGKRYITGHALVMTMPADWVTYGDESRSADGTTYEWAAGLPEETQPLPAGVQFSMGVEGEGVQFSSLPKGAKQLASEAPGYQLLDEGKVGVPGAEHASYLRFERDLQLDSGIKKVEQVSLFVEVRKGVTSTIRFIASAGDWDQQMKAAYESVQVADGGSA